MQNRRSQYIWLWVIILLLILGVSAYMILFADRKRDPVRLSVILSDSGNDCYTAVKQGMDQAAFDNDMEITYVNTDRFGSITDELNILKREAESGANAIIFEPVASDGYEEFLSANSGSCPMVLLDSDVIPEDRYSKVDEDNKAVGECLYEAVLSGNGGSLEGLKIGMITAYTGQEAVKERTEALLSHKDLKDAVSCIINIDGKDEAGLYGTLNSDPVDVIIAMGSYETQKAIDYITDNGLEGTVKLYGAGYSEKSIHFMDMGVVTFLCLTNEFNKGYLSVEAAYSQLKHGGIVRKTVNEVFAVNRENMYDEEFQKVLFPVVQ
ncbi:MAG: substrate-binding domain-containing protein [Lachnospiraceae bacterium]|nr:substrate-binding domain-containing protein [Lachnospiraceae bacterium]